MYIQVSLLVEKVSEHIMTALGEPPTLRTLSRELEKTALRYQGILSGQRIV